MGVLTLLLLGVMGLFLVMLRAAGSGTASISASLDAGNALQRMTADLREARRFDLQDTTNYDALDSGNNVVAVTGLLLTFPGSYSATTVAKDSGGASTATLSGSNALWDPTVTTGNTLLFYRSDTTGQAKPSTGTCLWAVGTENGVAVNGPIIKSIAPVVDALQFIQPYAPGSTTLVKNEIKIKLTTAVYDPIHGTASSDSTTGGQSELTGECTYLRDHDPHDVLSATTNGHTQN